MDQVSLKHFQFHWHKYFRNAKSLRKYIQTSNIVLLYNNGDDNNEKMPLGH